MPRKNKFDQYYKAYKEYYARERVIPSFSQTKSIMQVSSLSAVHRFHQHMLDHGYLIKQDSNYHAGPGLTSYEYFESVQAGFPSPANDDLKQDMNLEEYLIDKPLFTILVTVKGDSMINAGIYEGDVLIVEKGRKHVEGDIVVAVVDGEYTVKYIHKNKQGFYLKPANDDYPNIYPVNELEVFGVVNASFRKYH